MSNFNLCINSPVPDLREIREDFSRQLRATRESLPEYGAFLDEVSSVRIPKLLSLPEPMFIGYTNPLQELMEIPDAIKFQADALTMMGIFTPLVSVIGGNLEDLLPKIPVLNFSILDIVSGNIQSLHGAVVEALKDGVKLPFLPVEMFESYSNFAKESLLALKMILVGYKQMLISTMQSMIKSALKILKLSGTLPTLPTIPSVEQLKGMVLSSFPEYDSFYELLANEDISIITGAFGLGHLLLPEIDFIPNYSNYEQYLMESFNQIVDHFSSLGLRLLVGFVESSLGMLGFTFPEFCIGF